MKAFLWSWCAFLALCVIGFLFLVTREKPAREEDLFSEADRLDRAAAKWEEEQQWP